MSEFWRDSTTKSGLQTKCKPCGTLARKEWRDKNREKDNAYRRLEAQRNPERERARRVRFAFGITLEEYDRLLSGGCEICGATDRRMVLDHCHDQEAPRGGLCDKCNVGVGMFDDSPERLTAAAAYLERRAAPGLVAGLKDLP